MKRGVLFSKLFSLALVLLGLSACNFSAPSEVDQNYRPGLVASLTPVPHESFVQNWDFSTSGDYVRSNSSTLDFNLAGKVQLSAANQTDQDNSTTGFVTTSTPGVLWDATGNYLRLDHANSPVNRSSLDASWAPEWASIQAVWHLDETSGTATVDSTGKTTAGTINGPVVLNSSGKLSAAYGFNGTSTHVLTNLNISTLVNGYTISGWVKSSVGNGSTAGGAGWMWITAGQYNYNTGWFQCGRNNFSGDIRFDADTFSNAGAVVTTGSNITDGNWHYISCVWDRANAFKYIYVDGLFKVSQVAAVSNTSTNYGKLVIGAHGADSIGTISERWDGSIDEVAVWSTPLSAAEIALIYDRQSAKYASTYTSRVMNGLSTTPWTSLVPVTTLPFSKPLPDTLNAAVTPTVTPTATPISETNLAYSGQSSNLLNNLVALWHLDEPSGASNVIDRSGRNLQSTIGSAMKFGLHGIIGTAAQFDGTSGNASIYIPSLISNSQQITLSGWFNINTNSTNGYELISLGDHVAIHVNNGSAGISGFFSNATTWIGTNSFINSPSGVWTHVAYTIDTINHIQKIYLNGNPVTTTTATDAINYTGLGTNTYIGQNGNGNHEFFNGLIDEVAVWDRTLNDTEVMQLYRRGANRVRYQVRSCGDPTCAANPSWQGPDGSNQSYFSEMNNNTTPKHAGDLSLADSVKPSNLTLNFGDYATTGLAIANTQYFQYRAILESDDAGTSCNYGTPYSSTWCSPELKSLQVGPDHFDASNATVTSAAGVSFYTLTSLTETIGSGACTQGTLYNLSPDGTNWYWYNTATSAWETAIGTIATATASSEITSTRLASFPVGAGNLYFKVFLKSSGISACVIDNLAISGTR